MSSPAPTDLAEVLSPAWLTSALGARYPGVVVRSVTEVERLETVASKVRFAVDYETTAGHAIPSALCVKGYFGATSAQWVSVGSREARFYAELAPALPVQVPPTVYTGIDADTQHGVVVMHDLVAAGSTFLTALSPYTPDQVAATLGELALLHARTWDDARMRATPWLAPVFESYANALSDEELGALLDGPRGDGIPATVRRPGRIKASLGALARRHAGGPVCLIHADAHAGNLYEAPDGRPGLIDWQTYQLAHWSIDVAYHIGAVLEPAERAASERELLAHYLDRRSAHGVATPAFDDAWADYRAGLAYGYFMWAITRRVDEQVMLRFNRRMGTAVSEHDSLGLLGV